MTNFVITNPDATFNCFEHFREMRRKKERLDILLLVSGRIYADANVLCSTSKEQEVVGAHIIVLSAYYPVFERHLDGNNVVHVRLPNFSFEVINAAVDFAYGGVKNLAHRNAIKLYHLAHLLQGRALIDECTKFIRDRIEETDVSEVWMTANVTEDAALIEVCAPLVAMNWKTHRASRPLLVNTKINGMRRLLCCPQMAEVPDASKVETLLTWTSSSSNDEERTARINSFRDFIPLLGIKDFAELLRNLTARNIEVPENWRNWSLEESNSSTVHPSSSTD